MVRCLWRGTFECTDPIGCVAIAPDEPIKIGVLQVLSGDVGTYGRELLQSIEIAVDDQESELLGHRVELQVEDSGCSSEGGTTAALKIVADPQIVGVIGTSCSGAAATAMKVLSEPGLVMISSSNTAPSLTAVEGDKGADWQAGYFRTAQNDAALGRAAATFAFQELGMTKAATIDDGDTYTQGLAKAFSTVFTELGGEIVLDTAVNKGDEDMEPILTAVALSGADLVFLPIFPPEGNAIIEQAQALEAFERITLISANSMFQDEVIADVGAAGVGIHFVVPHLPAGEVFDTFIAKYETKYGAVGTPNFYAHSYDAANVLFAAIEAAAVQEDDGTLHIGRQALRDAMSATAGYDGLAGRLTCDAFGDCGPLRFEVVRLDDPTASIEGLVDNVVYTYAPEQ
ncbi:branched-chain amino acid ABC transporter substrate-binding protein [Chloroflexi bacterium TSY]|nr:branched-chain amino acid ABC transporter substrate-binding protein [Chloroflexi bacterium TSY]